MSNGQVPPLPGSRRHAAIGAGSCPGGSRAMDNKSAIASTASPPEPDAFTAVHAGAPATALVAVALSYQHAGALIAAHTAAAFANAAVALSDAHVVAFDAAHAAANAIALAAVTLKYTHAVAFAAAHTSAHAITLTAVAFSYAHVVACHRTYHSCPAIALIQPPTL